MIVFESVKVPTGHNSVILIQDVVCVCTGEEDFTYIIFDCFLFVLDKTKITLVHSIMLLIDKPVRYLTNNL